MKKELKIIKRFYRKNKKWINVIFGVLYIIFVLNSYNENLLACEGLNNLINTLMNEYSYCETDNDCSIYPPLTSDCEMPGACGMSLNMKTKPYYLNYKILNFKKSFCTQECTSVCMDYKELTPICVNNKCDFTTQ